MTLKEFNEMEREAAAKELFQCCGSEKWVAGLMTGFPFATERALVEMATEAWYSACSREDWLESFTHHPQIGDKSSLQQRFAGKEQAGVVAASEKVIDALESANGTYFKKFGFIFIVCATGKSAQEILLLMQQRLKNTRDGEIRIAMGEQHKITLLRLQKLFSNADFQFLRMSQLTTHVLDTSLGRPGKNIPVKLMQQDPVGWIAIAQGITNDDGRISDLLPPETCLPKGTYKLVFDTGLYFSACNVIGFYPELEIQFRVTDQSHYHVPLLISPFGYSTYRGS